MGRWLCLAILTLNFLGCTHSRDERVWQEHAPKRSEDLGYIVTGLEKSQLEHWLAENQYHGRVLSVEKNIFEVNAPLAEIQTLHPESATKNRFFLVNSASEFSPYLVSTIEEVEAAKHLYAEAIGLDHVSNSSQGRGVVVAILDTGVNFQHPDLQNSQWINTGEIPGNGIDDDGNGLVDDIDGWNFADFDNQTMDQSYEIHGSLVAGIVAGAQTGIAKDAKIMSVKVTSGGFGDWGTLIQGVAYADRMGANILNLSLSGPQITDDLQHAFTLAMGDRMFFVGSAGNSRRSCEEVRFFPGGYGLAMGISVVATGVGDMVNERMSYSNFGACYDLAAPGGKDQQGIISTAMPPEGESALYRFFDGTSAAAPLVTAAAVLLKGASSDLTPAQIKQIIIDSAEKKTSLQDSIPDGRFLRIDRALQLLQPPTTALTE